MPPYDFDSYTVDCATTVCICSAAVPEICGVYSYQACTLWVRICDLPD